MTKDEAATLLNGFEYPAREIETHAAALKAAGLVAVYGQSDDLIEFRGAINDEVGAWDGAKAMVDAKGLLPNRDDIDDDDELQEYFLRKPKARTIEALWSPDEIDASWLIRTEIPHATFDIVEDGDLYCRGIVFALSDA